MNGKRIAIRTALVGLVATAVACGGGGNQGETGGPAGASGPVEIDGSSTVYPITEAVAEEFQKANPDARVTVGVSGTGGGFKRFCAGETDVSDASRPIKDTEAETCRSNGIDWIEIPVGHDGIAVVVNPKNDAVACMTVEELKKIWEPGSTVKKWSDVRPSWPDEELRLYGPGTSHGTFDYFTEAIVGEEDASRPDYTAADDYNVLAQGVAGDPNGLGYFGFAYYDENQGRLKLLGVDSGNGCVQPSAETISDGTYTPLSRPIFIYVKKAALAKPQVASFVDYYLEHARDLVPQVGYVALDASQYGDSRQKVAAATPAE